MMQRGLPRNCLFLAAMCMGSGAKAGVWVTDPVLGLAADYSTNPGLRYAAHTAETHGAVLIDTPTTYHADSISLSLQPSFRISDSSGYSSLASDYAHLGVRGEIDSERNSVTVTAGHETSGVDATLVAEEAPTNVTPPASRSARTRRAIICTGPSLFLHAPCFPPTSLSWLHACATAHRSFIA